MKTTLGGDRLGSGKKQDIYLHGYSRSNHDLSYLWKSTMAPGTLVPFMCQVGLPGDTFDIDLDTIAKTHPTVGPLFGSFKLQLDVFNCPIRLYNKVLHNNKMGIGMKISQVMFPELILSGPPINHSSTVPPEFQQINQSCVLAYLGIRGLAGEKDGSPTDDLEMSFNALPYLSYIDIFKNYFANKQEDFAYQIIAEAPSITGMTLNGTSIYPISTPVTVPAGPYNYIEVTGINITPDNIMFAFNNGDFSLRDIAYNNDVIEIIEEGRHYLVHDIKLQYTDTDIEDIFLDPERIFMDASPKLIPFQLSLIDTMRENILSASSEVPFTISRTSDIMPYSGILELVNPGENTLMHTIYPQSGLLVKTYQSDLFNNWIKTEFITGVDSISEITKISTEGDSFTIDTFQLAKKVYDYLNRIATAGGTYQDWLEATYDHNSHWKAETPIYCGGLSKEIVFQEVVSQAATANDPLGSLAGKGVMSQKHKGGKVVINVDEPCYIIGIVSITPRVDYSQGNAWHVHLKSLDDLHKPALDGIGFQDLVTDQMVFWDTKNASGGGGQGALFNSVGKIPAWMNYMTDINKTYGNFADARNSMFMTLNRRYTKLPVGFDATTYIDPSKFNYAFAQTELSSQNFWIQIACNVYARRKMSAKIIPNL